MPLDEEKWKYIDMLFCWIKEHVEQRYVFLMQNHAGPKKHVQEDKKNVRLDRSRWAGYEAATKASHLPETTLIINMI
jgi:hypothetical protein